jgi:predicted esterase
VGLDEFPRGFPDVQPYGAEEPEAKWMWIHFHGWGEYADEYINDELKTTLQLFPSVRGYFPQGPPSTCFETGQTDPGWGHYETDKRGKAEDDMDEQSLEENTARAHRLLRHLSRISNAKLIVSGYSMGFGFAAHVVATLPAGVEVEACLLLNGLVMKDSEKYLANVRCKSFTVQWAEPLPMESARAQAVGDYFFRQWALDATQRRFALVGPAVEVCYGELLPEDHSAPSRYQTIASWMRSLGVLTPFKVSQADTQAKAQALAPPMLPRPRAPVRARKSDAPKGARKSRKK